MIHIADYDEIVIILAPSETAPLKLIHAKLHNFQIEKKKSIFSTQITLKNRQINVV